MVNNNNFTVHLGHTIKTKTHDVPKYAEDRNSYEMVERPHPISPFIQKPKTNKYSNIIRVKNEK